MSLLLWHLIFALVIAFLFSSLFMLGYRRRLPGSVAGMVFIMIFLSVLAGGMWINPAGPVLFGVHWVSLILIGLVIALILAAVLKPEFYRAKTPEPGMPQKPTAKVFNFFTYAFIVFLILLIVVALIWPRPIP